MQPYKHPVMKALNAKKYPYGLLVPCNKCLACRKERADQWAIRLTHEIKFYDKSCFVTLTYDDKKCENEVFSLNKKELQLFFKRFREWFPQNGFPRRDIKYFASGEYGGEGRPHYHAIIFGYSENEEQVNDYFISIAGALYDSWPYGNIYVGFVTLKSCRYVTGYVAEKLPKVVYENFGNRESPFQLTSQGFGERHLETYGEQYKENLGLTLSGIPHGLPRYYKKKLEIPFESYKEFINDRMVETYEHYLRKGVHPMLIQQSITKARKQAEQELRAKSEKIVRQKRM